MANRNDYFIRFITLYSICGILIFIIIARLFVMQIVDGEKYKEIAKGRLVKTMPLAAPRGEILDRYGRPLAVNRIGYSVQIIKFTSDQQILNTMLGALIPLIEEKDKDKIAYSMPITGYPYQFNAESEEDNKKFKKSLKLDENLSANDTIIKLKERYKISDTFSNDLALKLCGVRAEMEIRMFGANNNFVIASDVAIDTVTKIKEDSTELRGVNIVIEYLRKYPNDSLLAHTLGRTDRIYANEYDDLKKEGYSINDKVGKDGIEQVYEKYLRGKDGINNIEQDINGKILSTIPNQPPVPGQDVILTIDKNLQQVAETSLKNMIESIAKQNGSKDGHYADSGAVCVTDVNTGEVLALCSYPSYDLNKFNSEYTNNLKNPAKPMWNRAILGAYAPGSTFKILTSIAALEEGIIGINDTIYDEGIYKYYAPSYTPQCWLYTSNHQSHGYVNVETAIKVSCNYYFYEVGRLLGIDKLDLYAKKFGFGVKTGIDLPEENQGILASKEYREKIHKPWNPGDTLQAAIGQSDNIFTPVQLANYIATVANGGTRYKLNLLKKVKEYLSSKIISETNPTPAERIAMKPKNFQAVMQGMKSVTEDGTASSTFKDFNIAIGGKTGTASVPYGDANGIFVAFAPFDNPQIAISIVVEHGAHGNSVAPVARDILDQYFNKVSEYKEELYNGKLNID